jgi:hypothetical protein
VGCLHFVREYEYGALNRQALQRRSCGCIASRAGHKPLILEQLALSFLFIDSSPFPLFTPFHTIGHVLSKVDGLRAHARQRFAADRQSKHGEDLHRTNIKFSAIAKYLDSETTIQQTAVQWPGYLDICDLVNAPVSDNRNEKATTTMNIVKFRRNTERVLCIDRRAFMNLSDEFGFASY